MKIDFFCMYLWTPIPTPPPSQKTIIIQGPKWRHLHVSLSSVVQYSAYETSSHIKNALEYNVYHRCLCYFLIQLIVDCRR